MEERTGIVTMKGNPLTLVGKELIEGDSAPDFEALDNDLLPVRLSSFRGKVCVISSVPSLDTPVAMTSWGRLQRFDSFDPQTAAAFIEANRNKAPEPNAR